MTEDYKERKKAYNREYMRKRRQDETFRQKENDRQKQKRDFIRFRKTATAKELLKARIEQDVASYLALNGTLAELNFNGDCN